MKKLLQAAALGLFVAGTTCAQGVTKQETVKTTKIAQKNAKQLQKDTQQTGSSSARKDAAKTLDAAKRAEKQAKKTTDQAPRALAGLNCLQKGPNGERVDNTQSG